PQPGGGPAVRPARAAPPPARAGPAAALAGPAAVLAGSPAVLAGSPAVLAGPAAVAAHAVGAQALDGQAVPDRPGDNGVLLLVRRQPQQRVQASRDAGDPHLRRRRANGG